MALNTNFNVNPYYDDFDETKKYLRLLFKPGYAVQARELTQLQTILQKQVERFGNHIFQNGSVVTGGQFFLQDATYLKLSTTYNGTDINANNFVGMTILSTDETKRAEVIKAYSADAGTGDPITLMVKQVYGSAFTDSETIKTSEASPSFANISTSGVGTGQTFSVAQGVFYYEGFFIQNDAQTVAVSKYTNTTANARIGFEITESVVTNNSDTSLLDPAQNASNYQAPGADRYKINLVLATRSLASTDDTQFIELALVENGQIIRENKYPIYSVLEDTLARRTFDESGNYTVRDFRLSLGTNSSNTANVDVTLSPGKAYVYGYEFETNGPSKLTFDKPRTTASVANKRLTADYGNFVYTTNHYGSFPINSLTTVDLHCVNTASINTASTAAISNTKIGTVRVKSVAYESASNTSNGSTYTFRTYLFDANVASITGTVNSATSTTLTLANSVAGNVFSTIDDAYTGAKLRITSGSGSGEAPKVITDFVGSTQTITVDPAFTTTPTNASVFSIDFEFNDVESLANFSTTTKVVAADISSRSKDAATTYSDVYLSDTTLEPLIFRLGEEYVANSTIADLSFSYKRLYASQTFSANDSPALTLGTGEDIAAATSTSAKSQNYYVVVTAAGTSPYSVGQVIPADKFTVSTGTKKITVTDGGNMTANIIATIDVSTVSQKSKTYVTTNTTIQTASSSDRIDVFGNSAVVIFPSNGQCHIANTYVKKVPNQIQSLFMSDIIEVTNILDFGSNGISQANSSAAANVTTRYSFDTGQKDSYYDHSFIKLKAGETAPSGNVVVFFNRFTSSGAGFFTVDSYSGIAYGNIPTYSSPTNNSLYRLRDCLDFRPVRADATASGGSAVVFDVTPSTTGPKIPENGSDILLDYQYYLPRIDKIVLDKTKKFEVIKGIPALNPLPPNDSSTGMTLFVLSYSPYLADTQDVNIQQINHRRYTMRDIGSLESRIENLEYYTSLSLLEQDALSKQDLTILDNSNVERFKNGIVVDSFKGHAVADVTNNDYDASIDTISQELRPSFNISAHALTFDSANSSNFTRTGSLVTANSSATVFIDQPKSSKAVNVNPFNVINYLGKLKLSPSSDIWVDENHVPDVLVNVGGDRDAWQLITNTLPLTYEWNSWQTIWTGNDVRSTEQWEGRNLVQTTTTTTSQSQTRSGIVSRVVPQTITQSIGDRVVDVSIVPFMRSINVLFVGTDFKPNTALYPFFDETSVDNYVGDRVNKYFLTSNNIAFNVNYSNPEVITVKDKASSSNIANGVVVHTSNNIVYLTNMVINTAFDFTTANAANLQLIGAQTGLTYNVATYEHNGGNVNTATANTVTLRLDALNASNQNTINGSTIFITQGTGAGQNASIVAYNTATRVANISGTWTTTPDATSQYGIGRITTDAAGSIVGIFSIPSGTFRVGEKQFRLTDTSSGDIPSSSTNGDASFFAQGILQTKEETILSVVSPTIQRTAVTDNRVITNSTSSARVIQTINWSDPLAQTFLISPQQYPQGLYLSKIRLCFKSKDSTVPVTLQLRPTVNGYPSSSVVYPFSTVSLTPDKVKTSASPDMDDSTKYTEFVFDSPVYMQPGEHSFVLLANSNKYEVYVAEIGKLDTVTGRQISEQPYGGSLFLSQNGSTWNADQTSDMMFRLYRNSYSTSSVSAQFTVAYPATVVPYEVAHLITSDITVANTSLSYRANTEKADGSGFTGLTSITPLKNYEVIDGVGRKLSNTSGNITFTVVGTMSTLSNDVSPMIDVSRMAVITVENKINNLGLSNSGIVVSNVGSGYANSTDVTVTISGGGGSGATAVANVVSNTVNAVYITNAGSGYTSSPTITLTPGAGGGANAAVSYIGETEKSGGNAKARYISRRVTLADGFDSGDLRVYLNSNKPSGTSIYVYFKILSASDPESFDDKSWQLMTEIGNANYASLNENDYRELTFAPGVNGIANNSVSYTTSGTAFTTFRTFAIKIVMASSNTGVVPKIRDMRAIALPAG